MKDGWFGGFFTAISVIAFAVVAVSTFRVWQRADLLSSEFRILERRFDCQRQRCEEVCDLLHKTRIELGLEEDRSIHGWYTLNNPEVWKAVRGE